MQQDYQTFINLFAAAFLTVMGWFAKVLWDAVHTLREDLHQIEIELPNNYVKRDEYQDNMREIKDMLYKIFERLDNKADR